MSKDASSPPASCAVCGKPVSAKYRPFCSRRCADVDLARWLKGSYRIATDEPAEPVAPDEDFTPPGRNDPVH